MLFPVAGCWAYASHADRPQPCRLSARNYHQVKQSPSLFRRLVVHLAPGGSDTLNEKLTIEFPFESRKLPTVVETSACAMKHPRSYRSTLTRNRKYRLTNKMRVNSGSVSLAASARGCLTLQPPKAAFYWFWVIPCYPTVICCVYWVVSLHPSAWLDAVIGNGNLLIPGGYCV